MLKGNVRKRYVRLLYIFLMLDFFAMGFVYFMEVLGKIPNEMMFFVGKEEEIEWDAPVTGVFSGQNKTKQDIIYNFQNPCTMKIDETGKYSLSLKLFGIFDFKQMDIHVVEEKELIPGGENIGIYVETRGIFVLGNGKVTDINGVTQEPSKNVIQTGDYILAINKHKVEEIDDIAREMENEDGRAVCVTIVRNGEQQEVKINPIETEPGSYKLGIWVREDTQGLGTLTYRTKEGNFGALGHGITDSDTGQLLEIKGGEIYDSKIPKIIKGKQGKPGEVVGIIKSTPSMKLGNITENTECGIFGIMEENTLEKEHIHLEEKEALPIALKQEVEVGEAYIYCELDEEKPEKYEIKIDKIRNQASSESKGMILHITDPKLLEKTGGIIQGMSGSPIIQNGKIVGAVTHVFVNDPTRGYGIFIEDMLTNSK